MCVCLCLYRHVCVRVCVCVYVYHIIYIYDSYRIYIYMIHIISYIYIYIYIYTCLLSYIKSGRLSHAKAAVCCGYKGYKLVGFALSLFQDFTCCSVEVTGFILQYLCVASVSVWVAMQKKVCVEGFALQDYIMMWFTFYLFKCISSKRLHALCIPWLSRNGHEWIQAAQVWIRLQ